MKKLLVVLGMIVMSLFVKGQNYESVEVINNGMENPVEVGLFVIYIDSVITFDEVVKNRMGVTGFTREKSINNIAAQASFWASRGLKYPATWTPKKIFLSWDIDKQIFDGMIEGYAKNVYGVEMEFTEMIIMDTNGSIKLMF